MAKKTKPKSGKPGAKTTRASARSGSGRVKTAKAGRKTSAKTISGKKASKSTARQGARPTSARPVSGDHESRPSAIRERARVERPLTQEEIDQFRQMLLQKRAELLGDVSTLHNEALKKDRQDAAGDLSSMPIHMADLGTDNFELEFTLGLIEGERAILREIDAALDRIRAGTYGICEATGKPIGRARLRAKPWARYCYEYTLAQEQGLTRRS